MASHALNSFKITPERSANVIFFAPIAQGMDKHRMSSAIWHHLCIWRIADTFTHEIVHVAPIKVMNQVSCTCILVYFLCLSFLNCITHFTWNYIFTLTHADDFIYSLKLFIGYCVQLTMNNEFFSDMSIPLMSNLIDNVILHMHPWKFLLIVNYFFLFNVLPFIGMMFCLY